jgi:hypothetical protein
LWFSSVRLGKCRDSTKNWVVTSISGEHAAKCWLQGTTRIQLFLIQVSLPYNSEGTTITFSFVSFFTCLMLCSLLCTYHGTSAFYCLHCSQMQFTFQVIKLWNCSITEF